MTTTTEMRVHMCCPGCESKIKKTLDKMKGVDGVEIDMAMQKVTVNGIADQKKVLKAVRRTGRRAELWQFPYNPELRSFTHQYPTQCQSNGSIGSGSTSACGSTQAQPASSYNYFKHGYDGHEYHGYNPSLSSSFATGRTGDAFSDENPNGCFIM
ncbi:heavy metal-associated isoprenylated plant protein 28-like [Chenopodium quinoa]|uniref:heavy metal-associated isoprenylated plant protein 28-like n=1 Tax=Chenopodium quinoa TaxID=63459 RepID=UPI000B77872C|nr:heavy metal-associated isoprenylated plant protein 28-like [Chenopodium quinoa]